MSLLHHIAGFHRFVNIQRTQIVTLRGVHTTSVYTYISADKRLPKMTVHSPVPNTAGAHMQQRNAQCCTPLCLGWMDWHHSAEGTLDTCGQFSRVNLSSQYLTDIPHCD